MALNNISNKQLNELLKALEKFGFRFYGYNEAREPLVLAPNGQITSAIVAYNFVKSQISKRQAQQSADRNIEALNITDMPDIAESMSENTIENFQEKAPNKIESNLEKGIEFKSKEKESSNNATTAGKNPKEEKKVPTPYSFGFAPSAFNPESFDDIVSFINKNVKIKDDSNSTKWLATQFQKWLEEYQKR